MSVRVSIGERYDFLSEGFFIAQTTKCYIKDLSVCINTMNVTIVGLDLVKQYEDVSKNLNWPQSTRRETSNKELGTEKNDFRYSNMITDVYVTKCVLDEGNLLFQVILCFNLCDCSLLK